MGKGKTRVNRALHTCFDCRDSQDCIRDLYLHGENGDLALVEATPEAYREKGRFTPADQPNRGQSKAWAYPAIANGRLYIRDANVLWRYEIRSQGR